MDTSGLLNISTKWDLNMKCFFFFIIFFKHILLTHLFLLYLLTAFWAHTVRHQSLSDIEKARLNWSMSKLQSHI